MKPITKPVRCWAFVSKDPWGSGREHTLLFSTHVAAKSFTTNAHTHGRANLIGPIVRGYFVPDPPKKPKPAKKRSKR